MLSRIQLASPFKSTGSYQVSPTPDENNNNHKATINHYSTYKEPTVNCQLSPKELERDQNNNNNIKQTQFKIDSLGSLKIEQSRANDEDRQTSQVAQEFDFTRHRGARRLKKLRSISFSRIIYLRATHSASSGSYSLHRRDHENLDNNQNPSFPIYSVETNQKQHQQDGVTLCTLGVGTSFGATVMPGKSHSVSVVTNEECTLLRVRRADFPELFKSRAGESGPDPALLSDAAPLFYPFASCSQSQQMIAASERHQSFDPSRNRALIGDAPQLRPPTQADHPSGSEPLASDSHTPTNATNPIRMQTQTPLLGRQARRRSSLVSGSNASEYQRRQSIAVTTPTSQPLGQPPIRIGELQRVGAAALARRQSQLEQQSSSDTSSDIRHHLVAAAAGPTHNQRLPTTASSTNNEHELGQLERRLETSAKIVEEEQRQKQHQQQQLQQQLLHQQLERQQQEDPLEPADDDELNLESLNSGELSNQLLRASSSLRTLILANAPHMIKSRRVHPAHLSATYSSSLASRSSGLAGAPPNSTSTATATATKVSPKSMITPIKQHLNRHLVSMGSSSQLLVGAVAQSSSTQANNNNNNSNSSNAGNSARSAGRKVANYVASSFMRSATKQQQATANAAALSTAPNGRYTSSSSSFDQQFAAAAAADFQSSVMHQQESAGAGALPNHSSSLANSKQIHLYQEPLQLRRALVGREMVDWLLQLGQTNTNAGRFVTSRLQAVSMWQVLLEQGLIVRLLAPVGQSAGGGGGGGSSSGSLEMLGEPAAARRQASQFADEPHAYFKFWLDRSASGEDDQLTGQQTVGTGATSGESSHNLMNDKLPDPPNESEVALASESLWWSLKLLSKLAPDACFRLILSKRPHERSTEEVDIVFEELQHLKALSHLTNSVKKQLAACVQSEHHAKQNTIVFNQGDAGHSWYIILRGSVNVVIVGKGVVCTLHDGDDFGKLALVNDAPRAATIVTNEPHCYFLRVDKHDFNTILRDVEANTVRLKEHGKEVLILQKVAIKESQQQQAGSQADSQASSQEAINVQSSSLASAGTNSYDQQQQQQVGASEQQQAQSSQATSSQQQQASALKYMVMAGTAEKMLEHLLETRIDGQTQTAPLPMNKLALFQHDQVAQLIQCQGDNFLEDFILTHKIFMPTSALCQELLKQYQSSQAKQQQQQQQQQPASLISAGDNSSQQQRRQEAKQQTQITNNLDDEYLVAKKRRVIKFVRFWMLINREHFFQQHQIQSFVMTLHQKVKLDAQRFSSLQPELRAISRIHEFQLEENLDARHRGCQRWIEDVYGNMLPIRRHSGSWQAPTSAFDSSTGSPATANSCEDAATGGSGGSRLAVSEQFLASLHQRRFEHKLSTIQADDELVFRVYCADHSFTTLKCRFDEQAGQIKLVAARNLKLNDKELILVHVKSNGERIIYNDLETNICTCLSVNGRLFVCPLDHIDAISPLPEQDPFQEVYQALAASRQPFASLQQAASEQAAASGSQQLDGTTNSDQQQQQQQLQMQDSVGSTLTSHLLTQTPTSYQDIKLQMSLSVNKLEEFSSRDIAYCLTQLAWSLLKNMHEFELVYTVFGRHNFKQITANLNVFLRHFNEIQYWVVTQICLSSSLSKRVQILRKFIKIAAHCKELQNLNAFFAIIMGLSNMAVARLTQTWERLPSKLKRLFSQFESQIDPSRNHRRYRLFIAKLEPPIIPFMPLFLKDMTFAHEGNKTHLENGLINFEKMQMIAQTLRTIRYCKSRSMKLDVSSVCKFKSSVRSIELFFRDLKIIDNQRTLTQMSHQLEHRKA